MSIFCSILGETLLLLLFCVKFAIKRYEKARIQIGALNQVPPIGDNRRTRGEEKTHV